VLACGSHEAFEIGVSGQIDGIVALEGKKTLAFKNLFDDVSEVMEKVSRHVTETA
jgi:hypothetical protein